MERKVLEKRGLSKKKPIVKWLELSPKCYLWTARRRSFLMGSSVRGKVRKKRKSREERIIRGLRMKMNLPKINVENFGPIKKAEIFLKPVTVFVGPQGTGKSLLAQLIYLLRDYKWLTLQPGALYFSLMVLLELLRIFESSSLS